MKVVQADFWAGMINLFLSDSSFFHADLFSDDRGDLRQAFSALLADAMAA